MLASLVLLLALQSPGSAATPATVIENWDAPAERTLRGRVVDAGRRPVPGAAVDLRSRLARTSFLLGSARTDAAGRFALIASREPEDGWSREAFLDVTCDGWAPARVERVYVPPAAYDIGDVVIHPPVDVEGTVTDASGKPVAGARIHAALGEARAPYGDHVERPVFATTDASGAYRFRALPPGRVTLGVSARGFADDVSEPVELAPERLNRADFQLQRERICEVLVQAADGRPVSGAVAEPLGPVPEGNAIAFDDDMSKVRFAFWRGTAATDESGRLAMTGLGPGKLPQVLIDAPGYRPALHALRDGESQVTLQPVTWLEVVAERTDGSAPPELYEIGVRDRTRPSSWCGNCEDTRWVRLWADSKPVERVAPNHWRVAWNARGAVVDGGQPSWVAATGTDESRAELELSESIEAGARLECRLRFEPPARLSGNVADDRGKPISVRLGVQLSMSRSGWLSVTSGADGRFEFPSIGAGPQWLYALDDLWDVTRGERVELAAGRSLEGVRVTVQPRPPGRSGRVVGVVRVGGQAPKEPLMLVLDETEHQHVPECDPRGVTWTDAEGRFEIQAFWPRSYHIVPKHSMPRDGGWRDFGKEFPPHGDSWPWTVDVPADGTVEETIDFPPEEEWDTIG